MKLWAVLLATGALATAAWAEDVPRITFSKSFPGSAPAFFTITVERTGETSYNESEDPDNAEKIQLETGATAEVFELADRLDHFTKSLESGLKVAKMGEKTLRWESGADRSEAKFNYSTSDDARLMTDRFERIGDSVRMLLELQRAAKHDRLGVDAAVLRIQSMWYSKQLVGTAQFLPVLDQVAKNETYMHMARERAAQIVDAIRAASK